MGRVYRYLTATSLAAALGMAFFLAGIFGQVSQFNLTVFRIIILQSLFIPFLIFFVSFFGLLFTPPTPDNEQRRVALLMGSAFSNGAIAGPLAEYSLQLNPNILLSAVVSAVVVFGSFSMTALTSPRRSYLFLGGLLGSAMMGLFFLSLFNSFFGSQLLNSAGIYGGLLIFSGFTMYDTQLIVERAERGERDAVSHTLMLFQDLMGLFVRILVILTRREEERRRNDGNNNKRK